MAKTRYINDAIMSVEKIQKERKRKKKIERVRKRESEREREREREMFQIKPKYILFHNQ